MLKTIRTLSLIALLAATACQGALGQKLDKPSGDTAYLQDVFDKLLSAPSAQTHPDYLKSWPPTLLVQEDEDPNAFATTDGCKPYVVVTSGLASKILEGKPDRAAFVVGHELSHLLLGHVKCSAPEATTILQRLAFTRDQEYAADLNGMKLALEAGYSKSVGVSAYSRMDELYPGGSFEALASDHPSSKDRLAQLDDQNAALWRSMSAFDNGVYFLLTEHYQLAADAFDRITHEFPGAYEAWANLGYARLMLYADQLSPEDVQALHVNAIVAGGFYVRPESMMGELRGRDPAMWNSALVALRQADRLKPNSPIVLANLGLASLIKPDGSDAADAVQKLEQAVQLLNNDPSIDPVSATAIRMNLAVAYEAAGDSDKAKSTMDAMADILSRLVDAGAGGMIAPAYLYSRGMSLAATPAPTDQAKAWVAMETYLSTASPSSLWWPLAYERYKSLAATLKKPPLSKDELQARSGYALLQAYDVTTAGGRKIQLSTPNAEIEKSLGMGENATVAGSLKRVNFPALNVALLEDDKEVVAIVLDSPQSPPVTLKESGLGGKEISLRVGMKMTELETALKPENAARYAYSGLLSNDKRYRFYPDLGIALRVSDSNQVAEIVVVQVPRKQ